MYSSVFLQRFTPLRSLSKMCSGLHTRLLYNMSCKALIDYNQMYLGTQNSIRYRPNHKELERKMFETQWNVVERVDPFTWSRSSDIEKPEDKTVQI